MANVNTSLIIVPRIARNKRIYSGSTVISQSVPTPPPGAGAVELVPTDNVLYWNPTTKCYEPYTANVDDKGFAYFHIGANDSTRDYELRLDGTLYPNKLKIGKSAVYAYCDGEYITLVINNLVFRIEKTTNAFNIYSYDYDNSRSYPVLIGKDTVGNSEYISIDDFAQRFDINMTKIRLNKGTASKWLAIDSNKEIEYKDAPVPYTGASGNVDLGTNKIKAAEFQDANDNQKYAPQNGTILYHAAKWFIPASNQTLTVSSDGLSVTLANPVTNFQFTSAMQNAKIIVNGVERLINAYTSTSVVTIKRSHTNGSEAFPSSMWNKVYAYTLWGVYSMSFDVRSTGLIYCYSAVKTILFYTDANNFATISLLSTGMGYYLTNALLRVRYDFNIHYSNTTDYSGTKDLGFLRSAAKHLQIYNGVTKGALANIQQLGAKIGTSFITCLTTATNNTAVTSIAADTSSFPATGTILIGGVTSVTYTSKTGITFVFASTTIPTYAIGTIIELTAGATISYTEIGSTGEIKTNYGGAVDIGISRSAAGEYEINNGTAGTKRDLTARKIKADQFNLSALNTAPSSATDTGTAGEIRITASYIYVCTAANTWVRSALATW